MNEWYYAINGLQQGPVSLQEIQNLIRSGDLNPAKDLVWASHMNDWQPANQVEELRDHAMRQSAETAVADPLRIPVTEKPGNEIEPGSDPISVVGCISRGFDLTKNHFGDILLLGVAYFGILFVMAMGASFVKYMVAVACGLADGVPVDAAQWSEMPAPVIATDLIADLSFLLVSLYLSLGITRFALNLVSGRTAEVGQLFGEGGKLLRAIGGSILFFLMFFCGFLLLIVPGIYLALRYGQYLTAIVDRDLGVIEAFSYSSQITRNNKWQLLALGIVCSLVTLVGVMFCFIGVIFTGPVAWLAGIVAYRWLQNGRIAGQIPA